MSKLKSVRSDVWLKMDNLQPYPLTVTMEGTGSATAELLGKQILITLVSAEVDKYVNISTPLGFRVLGAHSIHGDATAFDWQIVNSGDAITSAIAVAASDKDIDVAVDIDDDYSTFLRNDDDLRIEMTTDAAIAVIVIDIEPTIE